MKFAFSLQGLAKEIQMTVYLRDKVVSEHTCAKLLVLTTDLLILLFTFCSKIFLTLFSIFSWKSFRIQLEKRVEGQDLLCD